MDGLKRGRSWRAIKPGERVIETRHETTKETLAPEVRLLIEQMQATINDHESRLGRMERFQQTLIGEAINKLKANA